MSRTLTRGKYSGCRARRVFYSCCVALLASLGFPRPAPADSFSISDWLLEVGVEGPGSTDDDSRAFITVTNPFVASHSAGPGASVCQGSYDFAWGEQFGHFLIQSTQQAAGVPSSMLFTTTSGFIYLAPSENTTLTVDAAWNYTFAGNMMARLLVSVYDPVAHITLFGNQQQADGFASSAGTLGIEGSVVLPPGPTWVLRYEMSLFTFDGTQGYSATGNGHVNFQITPEPATLGLLVCTALPLVRRARRKVRSSGNRPSLM